MAKIYSSDLTVEHIDPRKHSLICGFDKGPLAANNEIIAVCAYNSSKCNRFVPYRVGVCEAPIHPGDFGEFLIDGEWIICTFAVKGGLWWRESEKIGYGGNSNKGRKFSEETKKKKSEAMKGMLWWNNGVECMRSRECPGDGWAKGRLFTKDQKQNLSDQFSLASINTMFWNNGVVCVRSTAWPGEGWVRGRLPYSRRTSKGKS